MEPPDQRVMPLFPEACGQADIGGRRPQYMGEDGPRFQKLRLSMGDRVPGRTDPRKFDGNVAPDRGWTRVLHGATSERFFARDHPFRCDRPGLCESSR